MRHIYILILNHPAIVLAMLSLLMIAEMGVVWRSIIPIEYDWLLRWLVILTILAWASMAGMVSVLRITDCEMMRFAYWTLMVVVMATFVMLMFLGIPFFLYVGVPASIVIVVLIGLIAPADHSGMGYSIFIIAPLAFLALINLYHLGVVLSVGLSWFEWLPAWNVVMLVGLISGSLALLIHFLGKRVSPDRYIVVVSRSLGALSFILVSTPVVVGLSLNIAGIGAFVIVMPLYASAFLALLAAWWIKMLSPIGRKIVVSVLALWVMYVVMGWFWIVAIDNGLRAFTGDERAAAEAVLDRSHPSQYLFGPDKLRVVKDADGQFDVVFYTWWGLKANHNYQLGGR